MSPSFAFSSIILRHGFIWTLLAIASLALAGCLLTRSSLPPNLAHVRFDPISSAQIEVLTPRIRMVDGAPVLDGSLRRKFHGGSTARSILKVSCFDAAGNPVLIRLVPFTPAELHLHSLHPNNEGRYTMSLAGQSGKVVRIEVRAMTR